jgi:hypothetical protein
MNDPWLADMGMQDNAMDRGEFAEERLSFGFAHSEPGGKLGIRRATAIPE